MGIKVKITDPDTWDYVDSERAYIKHDITTTEQDSEGGYYGGRAEMGIHTFYEDEETGILTRDVGKFEAWMKSVITR